MQLILGAFLLFFSSHSFAGYGELGVGLGSISDGSAYTSGASSGGSGSSANLGFYLNAATFKSWLKADLGIQNRFTSGGNSAMLTNHVAGRIEIYRFFFGAGYAPFTFVNPNGVSLLNLKRNVGVSTYFVEAGAIWRVIPEFDIIASVSQEYGLTPSGRSPNPASSFGILFRFYFKTNSSSARSVEFDGFRYPFGIMK